MNDGGDNDDCFIRLTSAIRDTVSEYSTSVLTSFQFDAVNNPKMQFSTSFAYRIYSPPNTTNPHGNGMTFVIHQAPEQKHIVGEISGNLGAGYIGGTANDHMNPSVFVELDTGT